MYTIKRAAARLGLSADTLRAWERRYGVITPARSEGGYRLYDDVALHRLAAMKALVDAGWSPSQAAGRIRAAVDVDGVRPAGAPGGADVGSLARVGRELDGAALTLALEEGLGSGSFEEVVDGWLMPALDRLGAAWQEGSVGVAGEHFVSAGVQRRLATLFDAAAAPVDAPLVAVGLAGGSRHELGVLAFAVALRRAGTAVVYVGSDVPPEGWVDTVRAREVAAVVLGVPSPEDLPAVRETVEVLHREFADLRILVGGGHQDGVGHGVEPLGHGIAEAARELAGSLAGPSMGAATPPTGP